MARVEGDCLVDKMDYLGVAAVGSDTTLGDGSHTSGTYSCDRPGCSKTCAVLIEVKNKKILSSRLEEGGGPCRKDLGEE
jgi:hypothetical protein